MTRTFVNRKSEVTQQMDQYRLLGFTTYRTRLECNCAFNNRRNGILVIEPETLKLTAKVIRCRACRKEAADE